VLVVSDGTAAGGGVCTAALPTVALPRKPPGQSG
jgi:hypothetical protein